MLNALGQGTGYLKAGFMGFAGTGKTWTATELACGTREMFGLEGPIAMFDTEGGSEYIAPRVLAKTGRPLLGVRSRKFDDLLEVARECEREGVSVLIVDSVTHVWRELCETYLRQINEKRAKKGSGIQTRLEFQDWSAIKMKWATWTDHFLNCPLHVVICGRAGYEYDFEERDDDSGKKDLVKTGIKMKTEGEFGFEPSLLTLMERIPVLGDNKRPTGAVIRRATILKDRFGVIDAAQEDNPTFDFFRPHLALLNPGAHAPVAVDGQSDFGMTEDGDSWAREKRERAILCEEITGELLRVWPGQTVAEKTAKAESIERAFGTRSWTAVESMRSDRLREGLEIIRGLVSEAMAAKGDAA